MGDREHSWPALLLRCPSSLPLPPHESQIYECTILAHQFPSNSHLLAASMRYKVWNASEFRAPPLETFSALCHVTLGSQLVQKFILVKVNLQPQNLSRVGRLILSFQGRLSSFRGCSTGPHFKKHFER